MPQTLDSLENVPKNGEHTDYITGCKLARLVACVTLVVFLVALDQTIISTAAPTSDLNALDDIGWFAGAYQLASAALQPLTGKIYTFFRTKWTFLVFLSVFELGSLICGLATSSLMLIIGRAIAGAGSAGLTNGALTLISSSVPLEKRPLYTGVVLGIGQLGLIVAPLIGGALTQNASWHWCFYINLPAGGLAAIFLVFLHVPESVPKDPFSPALLHKALRNLDLFGFALFAPAAIMFLLALQFGSDDSYAWNSSVVIGLFVGSAVTAITFGFWERWLGDSAMIPSKVLKKRIVWASYGNSFSLVFVVFIANYYLPVYFQAVKGIGPTLSGVYLLPGILSQILFVILSGFAVSKLGFYMPWSLFGGIMAAIGGGLTSDFKPDTPTSKWVGYQLIQGIGRGAGMQMPLIATQNAVALDLIPISISLLIFVQNLAGSIAVVIATVVFTQSLLQDLPILAPSVSPATAVAAGSGADAVRALVPPDSPELQGLLLAFSNGVDKTFYLVAAFGATAFAFALLMGWNNVRKTESQSHTG
ncbi:major facilitator superfamily domain-containing protein [Xylariaceae sp. FL0804]|nr:major facilitator superfamily domain-containing protein [Xylariaceae sp. FL0804]